MEANYTFEVEVQNPTNTSPISWYPIRFKAGSWFYVEFTKATAPLFSKGGKYRCEIDKVVTYCTTMYERRLAILINKDLDPSITVPIYNISIIGIA